MRFTRTWEPVVRILVGLIIGYVGYLITLQKSPWSRIPQCTAGIVERNSPPPPTIGKPNQTAQPKQPRGLVFVGVMTAQKYLDTRALSVYRTWGQKLPGQMAFFSSEGSRSADPDLPLVSLPGVDDAYPPQKKSFLMLKYMFDHLVDEFEWFMRADDDVFVRGDKLEDFLRSLNSSKPLFIGQAGMGNKDEFGMLSLAPGENFCMGGPGIIISREVLRKMAPNIKYCLKHLYSTHEDVEIGRCIGKFAGVPCAWSYEMQTIFYHNQSGSAAFTRELHSKEVHRAITLHPVKTSQHLYRIQNYYNALKSSHLRQEVLDLQRDINDMNMLLYDKSDLSLARPHLNRFRPQHPDEVLEWDFFTKTLFSHLDFNPRRAPKSALKWALNDLIMQMMDSINQYSKQRGRIIDFKELLYGYQRVDPLHGVHYVLDLHLVYKRYSGRKMTAPVRRHAHLEQSFGRLEMVEERDCVGRRPSLQELKRDFGDAIYFYSPTQTAAGKSHLVDESRVAENGRHYGAAILRAKREEELGNVDQEDAFREGMEKAAAGILDPVDPNCAKPAGPVVVNFIVPISGRLDTLTRFLALLERVCFSRNESVSLTLINFPLGFSSDAINAKVTDLKRRYPGFLIDLVDLPGNFSRALALQTGAARFSSDSLLFFVDVDMALDGQALERLRRSTKINRMVYYPVVFSQYDPKSSKNASDDPFHLTEENGYWRQFGYGIASMYRADFDAVGGFDLSISGWGKEDVDLFEKFIKHGQEHTSFTVFRAVDPGLVHIYHPIVCDATLSDAQLVMCQGSRAASISGGRALARFLLENPDWLHAGWGNSSPTTASNALVTVTTVAGF